MLKLDTKGGIICSGCLSIAFAITYLALMDDYFWRQGLYELGIHISSLQILGSLVLIVGAVKQRHKFFVPWMITTGFFMYLMVYLLIILIVQGREWIFIPAMVVPFTVYLGCALYSVQKAFDRMRKEGPPAYTTLSDKKDFINHI
ncbi:uncharacterized protein LOC6528478 [Drosophila yakuba]|uniref:Uncharacterized protein n=1 Tax=Drosophila yakuba TaxID=7245 RepID=B4P235_DROYA|nr:uncharacterized protein LOC6528478 [Drosophila yakuba]XP_039501937.1 uncharacterized protein LOC120458381 [Drosophila santomea]EDW89236.1 uncharacterized protein Dyak_GE19148 [Drosophila yakuba]